MAKRVEIPEEMKEAVEKMHKNRKESRPDEAWRIAPPEKKESIAPYKKDEEESADMSVIDRLKSMGMPHFDQGTPGTVGDAVGGFDVDGGDSATMKMAGQGVVLPPPEEPETPPMTAPPTDEGSGPGEMTPKPAPDIMPPAPAMPAEPATTDQTYMDRANKLLGLNPEQQASFMKLLGGNAQKGQWGAALAGIGDAIASGGTLGKVNPGNAARAQDLIEGRTKQGLEGMQTIRGNQEKAQELSDKLQTRDPNSPLSKWAQKAYGGIGKKLGLDLSHASAQLIGDVAGKGVEALNTEYQGQLKQMGLDLQKQQVAATIANQRAERDIAREGHQAEAAKTLADRGILKTLANAVPGTAGHKATQILEKQAAGMPTNFAPDVIAYAQKHNLTPDQAQAVKDKRIGGGQ